MLAGVMPVRRTFELKEITGTACSVGAGVGLADLVGARVTGGSAGERVAVGAGDGAAPNPVSR